MIRWTVAGLIVVGLLVGIWMVWPSDGSSPTTLPEAAETTTSEMPTTTTSASTTTTTMDPLQVRDVETVKQAEAILRELWFGWFEGIYNQDEDLIREVVANPNQVEAAVEQFGQLEFQAAPSSQLLHLTDIEILRSDQDCLVVWATIDATQISGAQTDGVHVVRWFNDRWALLSLWGSPQELWEADCEALLGSSS